MPSPSVPAPNGGFEAVALALLTLLHLALTQAPASLPWLVFALVAGAFFLSKRG